MTCQHLQDPALLSACGSSKLLPGYVIYVMGWVPPWYSLTSFVEVKRHESGCSVPSFPFPLGCAARSVGFLPCCHGGPNPESMRVILVESVGPVSGSNFWRLGLCMEWLEQPCHKSGTGLTHLSPSHWHIYFFYSYIKSSYSTQVHWILQLSYKQCISLLCSISSRT